MRIQNILFPKEDICKETELYYRHPSKQFGNKFILPPNQTISFNTYFNSFSIEKWKEYTIIQNLSLNLKVSGRCRIDLYEATLTNGDVQTRLLLSKEKNSKENEITLSFPDVRNLHGICYFTITSDDGLCEIIDGFYGTEIDSESINRVKIGIGICTYKREQFILKNLKAIQDAIFDNPESEFHDNLEIIVSDNGETLQNYNYTHPKVKIFPNINAGGSGGFTRCMIEAIKAQEKLNLTHLLLMDDDIVLDPEILIRTFRILLFLKQENQNRMLGGVMLRLETPWIQNANGECYTSNLIKIIKSNGFSLDLRNETNILKNLDETANNYNGWWYTCIPMSIIKKDNLPFPFFLHMDDIEYGFRNKKEIILLNGIAVWHTLANKYTPFINYYDTRNRLITSIIRDPAKTTSLFQVKKYIVFSFISFICRYMYLDWSVYLKAVKDLCRGAEYFKQTSPMALQKELSTYSHVKEQLNDKFEAVFLSQQEIKNYYDKMEKFTLSQKILLLISIVNAFFPISFKKCIFTNNLCFQTLLGRKTILWRYSEYSSETVRLQRSSRKAICSLIEMIRLLFLVDRKWNNIKKKYQHSASELTSIEFWETYLKLKE